MQQVSFNNNNNIPTSSSSSKSNNNINDEEMYLYAIGGRSFGKTIGLTNRYSFQTKLWERGPTMNEPRGSLGVVFTDTGLIYSIAGSGVKSNLNSCEYLNVNKPLKEQNWTYGASLEVPRHALSATYSIESKKIYCVGGWKYGKESCATLDSLHFMNNNNNGNMTNTTTTTTQEGQQEHHQQTEIVVEEEELQKKWISCPRLITARKLHGVCSKNNKIYIFGGTTAGTFKPLTSAEVYDETKREWSPIRDLPRPAQCCATTVCNEIYIILWGNPKNIGILHYNTSTDTYVKISKLPISNWFGFAVTSFGTKIYLVGGIENGKWTGAFYSFDVLTKIWEQLPSLPFVRRRLSAVVYSKKISIQDNQINGKRKMDEYMKQNYNKNTNNHNNNNNNGKNKKKKRKMNDNNYNNNENMNKYEKIALVVEYDGKQYHGFQAQDNTNDISIQTTLEKALNMICTIQGRVNSAGRTDSGVHAIGMVVTAVVPSLSVSNDMLLKHFLQKLRTRVPKDISIRTICKVAMSFNPRKMAHNKRYTYCLALDMPIALGRQYAWDVSCWNIDITLLKDAAKCFQGMHDFTLFCERQKDIVNFTKKDNNNILTISNVIINVTNSRDKKVYISFEGKSFRHKQVRKMIHAIVDVARGVKTKEDIETQLVVLDVASSSSSNNNNNNHNLGSNDGVIRTKTKIPTNPTAPACGLTLSWIDYGEGYSNLCMKEEKK